MKYVSPERSLGPITATSLADLAEIVSRRRWSVILIILATIACTTGYLLLIRGDTYVAEARLLVRLGQEQAPSPTTIADKSLMVGNQGGYGSSELEMLRSRDLIAQLVDQIDWTEKPRPPPTTLFGKVREALREGWKELKDILDTVLIVAGLKPNLTPREAAIESVSRALIVESPPTSNLVIARMVWPQRGVPELLLKKLLDLYFIHRSTIYQGTTAANFFQQRRQETGASLNQAEAALSHFEREHGISNPDEQRSGLLKRLVEADTAVDSARFELEQAEGALRQFNEARDRGTPELATFAVSQFSTALQQSLAGQLATVAARWQAAQTTLSAQDQSVRHLRTEITAISSMLSQQLVAGVSQRQEQLAVRQSLRDGIRAELQSLQNALPDWQELRRAYASAVRAYEFNDGKFNEAQGIAALEAARIGNVAVVQQASEQAIPIGVRKSSMLMLATAGGVLLALMWVTVREFFDHRLHGPRDVDRRLGLRPLGTVPVDARGFAGRAPLGREAEETLARIAATIGGSLSAGGVHSLVVTAADTREGVTSVTANLGRHLVELLGLRVLLVDLGNTEPRLSAVVARMAVKPVPLTVDPAAPECFAGNAPPWAIAELREPTGTTGSVRPATLNGLVAAARSAYDIVLIDAAPPSSSVAALFAARAAGHALIVASANRLSYQSVQDVCDKLTEERAELMGCVLNRYKRPLPAWLEAALR
ncbi:MAG: Wzz/FepE/Etk N-terminal domain-containing protein [Acetobacteraceae bacterium]